MTRTYDLEKGQDYTRLSGTEGACEYGYWDFVRR